jgi:deferrochelatase/peroxidase EfeB
VSEGSERDRAADRPSRPGLTRRTVLSGAALLGLGAGLDHVITKSPRGTTAQSFGAETAEGAVPFYGDHQAGIATPAQDHLSFAAFDIASEAVDDLSGLLREWTAGLRPPDCASRSRLLPAPGLG